ncbi:peptide/nickel transport system permease protein [Nocardioides albertanoniae]|uniref:Peptide/nickel transport system permease protein n=1 Tax=Nocardioides albertanoniae TaxID=1175486 RepID=A0A543A710_9ACTN|nr:ABC transporter permease [Nocardioides albertanoniae]TQL68299.1 peptide/nickel transport system permease protein [Nocardioides albertanoniae]
MIGFVVRRLISALLVLFVISVAVVALFTYGPSDPADAMCPEPKCTAERQDAIREALNLEAPIYVQYGEYMSGIVNGRQIAFGSEAYDCQAPCFGVSFIYRVNVWDDIKDRVAPTVSVALGAGVTILLIGVPIGMFAARRRGTSADKAVIGATLVIESIPYYLFVLLAFLYLAVGAGIFPQEGYHSLIDSPLKWAWGLLLPWLALGLVNSSKYARFTRGSMIEAFNEDYVRTARAKGLHERKIVNKHALRAAVVPIVTIFGIDFGALLTGTIFTELIFGIPGLGLRALNAVSQSDLPVIEATTLISALIIVITNLLVDLFYSVLDPRVRIS